MSKKYKVVNSEIALANKFFHLIKDTISVEQNLFEYYYMQSPQDTDFVTCVGLDNQKKNFILTVQYRPPVKKEIIQHCGGMMNTNESRVDAIKREFVEETGYVGKEVIYLGESFVDPGRSKHTYYEFIILNCKKKQTQMKDINEDIKPYILPVDKAWDAIITSKIKTTFAVTTLVKALIYLKIYPN